VRALLLAVLLAAAGPAGAQMFKCVDAKGRTHYTDKPLPGCKGESEMRPPAQPQTRPLLPTTQTKKPAPAAKKRAAPKKEVAWSDPKQFAAHCKGLRQEEAYWVSKRNHEQRDARLGQVRQALQGCP
jgi:hypothetical protein